MPKVMLAEDDATMVALLKILLKMEQFEVVAIQPDDDVLAAVRNEKPSLLLMDLHLGMKNGLDLLMDIRSREEFSNLPIVMASGSNSKDECLAKGANAFIMKPYMPDELISVIKKSIKPN